MNLPEALKESKRRFEQGEGRDGDGPIYVSGSFGGWIAWSPGWLYKFTYNELVADDWEAVRK